jgi:hypothetical protein
MEKDEVANAIDTPQEPAVSRSALSDTLISGREFALDLLSGSNKRRVVNRHLAISPMQPSADLAEKLKQTLDDLKLSVMDVEGTSVDYDALRVSKAYEKYHSECLSVLNSFNPELLSSIQARRAFWVNLYNALVLDAVIDFGVKKSVTEGRLGMLTFFRRAAYSVNGERVSLEDIEHGILRGNKGNPYIPGVHFRSADPRLKWALPLDPRIHFALNCGGKSCPPIRSYSAERLDEQLDIAARSFIDGTVEIRSESSTVALSQIFKWYESDFGGRDGVVEFLIRHLPDDERRRYLVSSAGDLALEHRSYDWTLNGT